MNVHICATIVICKASGATYRQCVRYFEEKWSDLIRNFWETYEDPCGEFVNGSIAIFNDMSNQVFVKTEYLQLISEMYSS